ncbi:S8 family serine peptidase [Streptomyces sp. BR123]|nr:S8 family serine peptidase [Streptomyces sp. BR123]
MPAARPPERPATSKPVCTPKPGRATCQSLVRTDLPAVRSLTPGSLPAGYGPPHIRRIYQLPFGGGGRTVAIVSAFHYPTAEADLAEYRRTYGLPPCTTANGCFDQVYATGVQPPVDAGWALESAIDIEAVSASCPRCRIVLVEAASDVIGDLLNAVTVARTGVPGVFPPAKFISMSWGDGENPVQPVIDPTYFDFPGVAFVASSGNTGGVPDWPALSKFVTAAGGTRINEVANPVPGPQRTRPRPYYETAWSGSGSGCTQFQPKPVWQADTICPTTRTSVDVSALADPTTGISIYTTTPTPDNQTGWLIAGGTSVASPLIAGIYAQAGNPGPNDRPNSYPYANRRFFWDINVGTAGAFSAGLGYDAPTGVGSPRGVRGFRR